MSNGVSQEDITKALEALNDLAKGGKTKTPTTTVESMKGSTGDSHLFTPKGNSDPNGWAGSKGKDVPENGATDGISDNGTDYTGAKKMMKSIMEKIRKGQELTVSEANFLAKAMDKVPFGDDEDEVNKGKGKALDEGVDPGHPDAEEDKELIEDMMGKSLADHARANPTVNAGFEVSDFLAHFADVVHKSLVSAETRIRKDYSRKDSEISKALEEQAQFNKSLAQAIADLGNALGVQAQRIEQVETAPARAPRSTSVTPINKSFGVEGEGLSKSMVLERMVDLVKSGKLDRHDVIKFETTGELRQDVAQLIKASLAS